MDIYTNKAEDHDLWDLLNRTFHLISRQREKELSPFNITRSQVRILWTVQALGDKATITEISRCGYFKPNAISQTVKKMVKAGLLVRVKAAGRKRSVVIKLTDKGLRASNEAISMESIHRVLSVLSKKQRQELMSILRLLINKVGAEISLNETRFALPSEFMSHVKALAPKK